MGDSSGLQSDCACCPQTKVGKDLAAQAARLSQQATATIQKLLDNDTKFASEHLKGVDQGGSYAEASVLAARGQLLQADTAIAAARWVILPLLTLPASGVASVSVAQQNVCHGGCYASMCELKLPPCSSFLEDYIAHSCLSSLSLRHS